MEGNMMMKKIDVSGKGLGRRKRHELEESISRRLEGRVPISFVCNNNALNDESLWWTLSAISKASVMALYLANNAIGNQGAAMIGSFVVSSCLHLQVLDVSMNTIGDGGCMQLCSALAMNTTITELNLDHNNISRVGATAVAEVLQQHVSLQCVKISHNVIGDDGVVPFASLTSKCALRELHLSGNSITDEGARRLSALDAPLVTMDLSSNHICDRGLISLAQLVQRCGTLENVIVENNPYTSAGSHVLLEALCSVPNPALLSSRDTFHQPHRRQLSEDLFWCTVNTLSESHPISPNIKELLSRGGSPNFLCEHEMSGVKLRSNVLHWACRCGHAEAVELFLKQGANANLPDSRGRLPLALTDNPRILNKLYRAMTIIRRRFAISDSQPLMQVAGGIAGNDVLRCLDLSGSGALGECCVSSLDGSERATTSVEEQPTEERDSILYTLAKGLGITNSIRSLDIGACRIRELSSTLQRVTSLTNLALNDNLISVIPPWVSVLCNLKSLSVARNMLVSLPAELASLTQLRRLNASGNNLAQIPSEFSSLQSLTMLDLSNNRFEDVPGALTSLRALRSLNLSLNDIRRLPEQLGGLRDLGFLCLDHMQLHSLPRTFGDLTDLYCLSVRGNSLQSLPIDLHRLEDSLVNLDCGQNRGIRFPPLSVANAGTHHILQFLRETADGESQWKRVKVVVIGNGNTGKTTILKALRKKEKQTVIGNMFDKLYRRNVLVNESTFGVLVGDDIIKKLLDDLVKTRESVTYWLRYLEQHLSSIRVDIDDSGSDNGDGVASGRTYGGGHGVILVGNKKDRIQSTSAQEAHLDQLKELGASMRGLKVVNCMLMSALKSQGVERLKREIVRAGLTIVSPERSLGVPKFIRAIGDSVREMKDARAIPPIVAKEELFSRAELRGFAAGQLLAAIEHLHNVGIVVYHELASLVCVYPRVLALLMAAFICPPEHLKGPLGLIGQPDKAREYFLAREAVREWSSTEQLLNAVLLHLEHSEVGAEAPLSGFLETKEEKLSFLRLLAHFDLCVELTHTQLASYTGPRGLRSKELLLDDSEHVPVVEDTRPSETKSSGPAFVFPALRPFGEWFTWPQLPLAVKDCQIAGVQVDGINCALSLTLFARLQARLRQFHYQKYVTFVNAEMLRVVSEDFVGSGLLLLNREHMETKEQSTVYDRVETKPSPAVEDELMTSEDVSELQSPVSLERGTDEQSDIDWSRDFFGQRLDRSRERSGAAGSVWIVLRGGNGEMRDEVTSLESKSRHHDASMNVKGVRNVIDALSVVVGVVREFISVEFPGIQLRISRLCPRCVASTLYFPSNRVSFAPKPEFADVHEPLDHDSLLIKHVLCTRGHQLSMLEDETGSTELPTNQLIAARKGNPRLPATPATARRSGPEAAERLSSNGLVDRWSLPFVGDTFSNVPWAPMNGDLFDVSKHNWIRVHANLEQRRNHDVNMLLLDRSRLQLMSDAEQQEFHRVCALVSNMCAKDGSPNGLQVQRVVVLQNDHCEQRFLREFSSVLDRTLHLQGGQAAGVYKYLMEPDPEPSSSDMARRLRARRKWRHWIMQHLESYTSMAISGNQRVNLVPSLHGTSVAKALLISSNGFYHPRKIRLRNDCGYFGNGIYQTQSPNYALQYSIATGRDSGVEICGADDLSGVLPSDISNTTDSEPEDGVDLGASSRLHVKRRKQALSQPWAAAHDLYGQQKSKHLAMKLHSCFTSGFPLILSWSLMGDVFPVCEYPKQNGGFYNSKLRAAYDSHYTVVKGESTNDMLPCSPSEGPPVADEIVLKRETQVLPRYLVFVTRTQILLWLDPSLAKRANKNNLIFVSDLKRQYKHIRVIAFEKAQSLRAWICENKEKLELAQLARHGNLRVMCSRRLSADEGGEDGGAAVCQWLKDPSENNRLPPTPFMIYCIKVDEARASLARFGLLDTSHVYVTAQEPLAWRFASFQPPVEVIQKEEQPSVSQIFQPMSPQAVDSEDSTTIEFDVDSLRDSAALDMDVSFDDDGDDGEHGDDDEVEVVLDDY